MVASYSYFNKKIIILNDGIEALNLIYYDTLFYMKISMIICDWNMKFMNGDFLFKVMNLINNNAFQMIKFVMYTNTDIKTVMENVKRLKFYLKKPCNKKDIEKLYDNIKERKFD